jgi:hypothetical protein
MNVFTLDDYTIRLPVLYIKNSTVLSMFLNRTKSKCSCNILDCNCNIIEKSEKGIKLPVSLSILKTSIEYFYLIYTHNCIDCIEIEVHENENENEPIDDLVQYFHQLVSNLEYNFLVNLNFITILELFKFADYINFKQLKKITSLKIAFEIKQCKTVEEVRNFFDVKNNFEEAEYTLLINESDCLHSKCVLN